MAVPDRLREFFTEFAEVQSRPITDRALLDRARTDATRWINAAHAQRRRIVLAADDPDGSGDAFWQLEIDFHYLLVALTRLRRAVVMATRVEGLHGALVERINSFDHLVPYLAKLRNTGEHFDDYTSDNGRDPTVRRFQLQTWSLGGDGDEGLTWYWLGEQVRLADAHSAATSLYRGFMADAERFVAVPGDVP